MKKEKIRKFSARATDFIAAYHVLHADGGGKAHPNGKAHTELTMHDIKKTRRASIGCCKAAAAASDAP
eukprot:scaffold44388_cov61-Attheya_sp.AAC.1